MPKMKKYGSFTDFHEDQLPEHRHIISALDDLISKLRPELEKSVKWGNGVWLHDESPVLYAHCEKDHVQFGFFNGSALDDPDNILIGSGKYVRHIKIRCPKEVRIRMLRTLIVSAQGIKR